MVLGAVTGQIGSATKSANTVASISTLIHRWQRLPIRPDRPSRFYTPMSLAYQANTDFNIQDFSSAWLTT